jgi:predicted nicotinamide N-methyase
MQRANRDHWNATSDRYQAGHGDQLARAPKAWGGWSVPESEVLALGDLSELRVLELGCGAGLVATVAAVAGFRVCATDYYEDALRFTELNVAEETGLVPETRLVDWRKIPTDLGRFDLVVGSDVLYERIYGRLVAKAIDMTLARNGEAVIADPGRIAADEFVYAARARGLALVSHERIPYVDGAIRQTISLYRFKRA